MAQPPRSRGSKRGIISYPPCYDGGTKYQLKSMDFTQAMHSARLGNVLCNANPMQQKFLHAQKKRLREMNKRHQDAIFQTQRTFFMTQVFDKGLNLYHTDIASPVPKTQSVKGEVDPLPDRTTPIKNNVAEMVAGKENTMNNEREQRQPTPLYRPMTTGNISEKVSLHDERNRTTESPLIRRECRVSKTEDAGLNTMKTMVSMVNSTSPVLPMRREITLPPLHSMPGRPLQGGGTLPVDTPEPVVEAPSTPIITDYLKPRGEQMTIARLRKSSAPIFPKLRKLLEEGPDDHADSDQEVEAEPPIKVDSPPADTRGHDVKLVQRLTAYLPQHVIKRAEDQIRQMSNSVEIYAQKKKLLESNRRQIEADITQDERWSKLYKKLSPTHGMGLQWRKANLPCKWTTY